MAGDAHPFGDEPAERPVKPVYFDPCADYIPRRRWRRDAHGKAFNADLIQPTKEQPVATTALAVKDESTIAVTSEQLDLIKRTVAQGATADELKLYLFDCQRQGVHPLDKLVHFTKRAGKYTPITSIDFMRIRAAETDEYAGSDDAQFDMGPDMQTMRASTVTVWRLVQGTRCPFTATARWSEYKPDQNDFMWKKMPHTMLAKCAEALALRKGFPRQLHGLYAKEEMDQAGGALAVVPAPASPAAIPAVREGERETRSAATGEIRGTSTELDNLPEGYRLIDEYKLDGGEWHHVTWGRDAQGGWMTYKTKLAKVGLMAKAAYESRMPVRIYSNKYPFLDKVESLGIFVEQIAASKFTPDDDAFCDECNRPVKECMC